MTAISSLPTARDLWGIPAWRHAFPASVISRLGDFVFDTTVALWIGTEIARGQTWAPAAVSGVLAAAALPVLLVGPVAGALCDRHDRHAILMWSNLVQAMAMGSLLAVPALGDTLPIWAQLAWIYAAILVTNAAGQFFAIARMLMITTTIPDELLTSAYAVQGGANNVVMMIGPPLAAPLLFALGVQWALILNAASFLISCALLTTVSWDSRPPRTGAAGGLWHSLVEGFGVILGNHMILAIMGAVTIATLGSGILNALMLFFVVDVVHAPAGMVGVLEGLFAGATILGVALAPWAERRLGAPRTFVLGMALVGIMIMAFSRQTNLWVACAVLSLGAIPLGAVNTVIQPVFVRAVPRETLGRAGAALNVLPTVASLVAVGAAGWLASTVLRGLDISLPGIHLGPIDTLILVAGLLNVLAALICWRPILAPRPAVGEAESR